MEAVLRVVEKRGSKFVNMDGHCLTTDSNYMSLSGTNAMAAPRDPPLSTRRASQLLHSDEKEFVVTVVDLKGAAPLQKGHGENSAGGLPGGLAGPFQVNTLRVRPRLPFRPAISLGKS